MTPLYNKHGKVIAFLGRNNRIVGLRGESKAWINSNGSIHDYRGKHIGWWKDDHMRGRDGGVAAWVKGARALGVIPPIPSIPPIAPISSIEPIRPIASIPPIKPINKLSWSSDNFFEDVA